MNRKATIELLRFISAVSMVIFHLNHLYISEGWYLSRHGNFGVDFFFVISGFFMVMKAVKTVCSGKDTYGCKTWEYTIKRIKQIYFPFIIAWIVMFTVTIFTYERENVSIVWIVKQFIKSIFEFLFLKHAGFKGIYELGQLWYISALIIVGLVCFPAIMKLKDNYIYIYAPVIAVMVLGFLNHEYNSLVNPTKWVGIMYKGNFRAIGEINLGIMIYGIVQKISLIHFTKLGKILLSLLEFFGYVLYVYYVFFAGEQNNDCYVLAFLAISIIITMSQQTYIEDVLLKLRTIILFLGKLSLYIYIGHQSIRKIFSWKVENDGWGVKETLLPYVIAALLFSLILYGLDELWKKRISKVVKNKLFVTAE